MIRLIGGIFHALLDRVGWRGFARVWRWVFLLINDCVADVRKVDFHLMLWTIFDLIVLRLCRSARLAFPSLFSFAW